MSAWSRVFAGLILVVAAACGPTAERVAQASPSPKADDTAEGQAVDSNLPLPDLGYVARQGQALFRYYCSTCHGPEGRGDGFNAYNLDPKPRDLSDPAFQAERSDAELAEAIRKGGPAAGLSSGMPPWGGTLSERAIGELVIYLRTLKPEDD